MKTIIQNPRWLVSLIGGLSLVTLLLGCSKEPMKDGVPLKVWVKQLGHSEMLLRIEAAEAIGAIGKPAREKAEPMLTNLAGNDPMPRVRVAAILALKEMGAPTTEFDEYLEEVMTPLSAFTDEDLTGAETFDEEGNIDENSLFRGLAEDDLGFLEELENRPPDTMVTSVDVMPVDPESLKVWQEARRREQIDDLRKQLSNPEILAEFLLTGELFEKRYAARLLADKEGVSERVFNALTIAATDKDSLLKMLSGEALKKWQKE